MGVAGTDKHLGMESISAKVVGEGGLGLIVGRILLKFPLIVSHLSFLRWEFFTDISERLREHESHTLCFTPAVADFFQPLLIFVMVKYNLPIRALTSAWPPEKVSMFC